MSPSRSLAVRAALFASTLGLPTALARLIELKHDLRCLGVEVVIFRRELLQLARGDAVILGAKEQKRHRGIPGEAERFRQDQQRLPVPVEQRALDQVGWHCT